MLRRCDGCTAALLRRLTRGETVLLWGRLALARPVWGCRTLAESVAAGLSAAWSRGMKNRGGVDGT